MDTFMKTYTEKNLKNERKSIWEILIYYKKKIKSFLAFHEKSSEYILWVKITKGFLHADREIFLAGVYNSPKHSNYTKEKNCNVIDILREQLSKF